MIVLVVGGLWWSQNYNAELSENEGMLYVGVTDATADIANVNEINMEVKKVEIYSSAEGWSTISANSKKYDLLALKANAKTELYASQEIEAGAYERVRVTLGDTVVKTKTEGDVDAFMPARQIVLNMDINVVAGKDTHVELDFLADQSLHATADGKFVFVPVVNAQAESNSTVTVGSGNAVVATGGTMDSAVSVGMDIDGSSKNNFSLVTGSDFSVDSSTGSEIKFIIGGKTYTESKIVPEASLDFNSTGDVQLDTDVDTEDNLDVDLDAEGEIDGTGGPEADYDIYDALYLTL